MLCSHCVFRLIRQSSAGPYLHKNVAEIQTLNFIVIKLVLLSATGGTATVIVTAGDKASEHYFSKETKTMHVPQME